MKKQARGLLFRYSLLHFCVDWACILLVTGAVGVWPGLFGAKSREGGPC